MMTCAFVSLVALAASGGNDVLQAHGFELLDSGGHVIARLSQGCDSAGEYSATTADCAPGVFVRRPEGGFSRVTLLPSPSLSLKPLGNE